MLMLLDRFVVGAWLSPRCLIWIGVGPAHMVERIRVRGPDGNNWAVSRCTVVRVQRRRRRRRRRGRDGRLRTRRPEVGLELWVIHVMILKLVCVVLLLLLLLLLQLLPPGLDIARRRRPLRIWWQRNEHRGIERMQTQLISRSIPRPPANIRSMARISHIPVRLKRIVQRQRGLRRSRGESTLRVILVDHRVLVFVSHVFRPMLCPAVPPTVSVHVRIVRVCIG
ncbi:unnamed protein product [Mycena citricolor]|uniref:Uncharacterized protein n=1 Tax=Mycena citricolor TaxID=2018698 RepID=A0AAD2HJT5_9AGAR|nr:unnamed protein product [Mycena citricolor]